MGFMDKVKETAAKGTEMAKGAAKAGQEKIDEQKTKKKISDLKEELGGVVYAQRSGATTAGLDPEVEIARIVAELNAAVAELPDEDTSVASDESGESAGP